MMYYSEKINAEYLVKFKNYAVDLMDDFVECVKTHQDKVHFITTKEMNILCVSISKEEMNKVVHGTSINPTTLSIPFKNEGEKCRGIMFIVHNEYSVELSKELIQFLIYHEIGHILNIPNLTKKETSIEVEVLADLKALEMLQWDITMIKNVFNEWFNATEKTYSNQKITHNLKIRLEKIMSYKNGICNFN